MDVAQQPPLLGAFFNFAWLTCLRGLFYKSPHKGNLMNFVLRISSLIFCAAPYRFILPADLLLPPDIPPGSSED